MASDLMYPLQGRDRASIEAGRSVCVERFRRSLYAAKYNKYSFCGATSPRRVIGDTLIKGNEPLHRLRQ